MGFRILVSLIQLLGFPSRATTGNHRAPSSYYPITLSGSSEFEFWTPRQSNTPLGFSSRAATGNHRTPSSFYPIIPARKPRSSERHSMLFRTHVHPIQLLGFSSRATTANHRGPSSYYPIIPARKPRSSESTQCSSGLTSIQYSF